MATPVKEKTPLELRAERLLDESMRYSSDEDDEALRERNVNEPLYSFFRRRIKSQIVYHMGKYQKPQKRRRKLPNRTPSPSKFRREDLDDETPANFVSPAKKRAQSQANSAKKNLKVSWGLSPGKESRKDAPNRLKSADIAPVSESKQLLKDFGRLRELLKTRQNVTEAAVAQIRAERKYLNQIKVTTARDRINLQLEEIEERNENLAQDLEKQLMVLLDVGRTVDKIYTGIDADRAEMKDQYEEQLEEYLLKEKERNKQQHGALQLRNNDLNKEVRGFKNAQDTIASLEAEVLSLNKELDRRNRELTNYTGEMTQLNESVSYKDSEMRRMELELNSRGDLLRQTENNFNQQLDQANNEIFSLNEQIKLMRQSESVGLENLNNAKDREIDRLKDEIVRLQEELNLRIKSAHSDEERFNENLSELKRELNRLESRNKSLSLTENEESRNLRDTLRESEMRYATERDQMADALNQKEKYRLKQKNEWAEIYTGLKHEIKELKGRLSEMTMESDKLVRQLDHNQSQGIEAESSLKGQNDGLRSRLKEREMEAASLWEVLNEANRLQTSKGRIDMKDIQALLALKNMDDKARRKFK